MTPPEFIQLYGLILRSALLWDGLLVRFVTKRIKEMRTLRKLEESEKGYWIRGEYGIVENGKVLFQGSYRGCLEWLSSGN